MTKKIKLGLSAMVAFAMMFATSVSIVAQEVTVSNKVKVTESVEAETVAEAVKKGNHTAATTNKIAENRLLNESMLNPQNFTITPGQPIDQQSSWSPGLSMCDGENDLCGITFETSRYPLDASGKPNDEVLSAVEAGWDTVSDGEEIGSTGIIVHLRE